MEFNLQNIKPSISWVKSELIEQRIDSQFYKSEYVINEMKIKKLNNTLLKDMYYKGEYGTLPDSDDYCDEGIYLIRGTDLRELSIDEKNLIVVPKEYFNEKSEVKTEDILMLIKGATIDAEWSVAIMPKNNYKAIFNGSIFRIRLNKGYDPYFLTAFMSTKYFLRQKKRAISNTGIFYNDKESIEKFVIPIPSPELQKYIGDKIRKAEELREEAKRLKKEAEDLINEELNLKHSESNRRNNKFDWLNNEILTDRIDSDYYKEEFIITIKRLIKSVEKHTTLRDIVQEVYTGKKPVEFNDGIECYFVQSGNISSNFLELNDKVNVDIKKYNPVQYGDVLMAKDGETIGKLAINYTGETIIINEHTYCLKFKEDYKNYGAYMYYLLTNTNINKLIRREATGSAQKGLNQQFLENMIIPIIDDELINKFYKLEKRRCECIYKSKNLINDAKCDIENLIEGNFDKSKINENN